MAEFERSIPRLTVMLATNGMIGAGLLRRVVVTMCVPVSWPRA